jgi:hypothetical protein
VDDFEVTDLRVLTLGNKVPAEGNVLRALPEACLLREGNSCFAVFVEDRRTVLVKAHFDAEFAKKETFLCGRAEADDLGFSGVKHLQLCLR